MKTYKEIIKWFNNGIGEVERAISERVVEGNITEIKGLELERLIEIRNKYPYGEKINLNIYPNDTYYIYYNYHSSTAYHTDFTEEDDILKPNIKKTDGFCFPACTSEVVVFSKSKVLQFPKK